VAENNVIFVVCDKLLKITYFMTITEGTSVEQLAKLLRDNMWKLYRLPESVISNKEL